MVVLGLDLETYSSVDLKKCGVYSYAESKDFKILLFAYAFDDNPVEIIDLASGENLPDSVSRALTDPNIIKCAFNAAFERTCLKKWFNKEIPPEQWACTAVHAATLGLPRSLDGVGDALGLNVGHRKLASGANLIRYFSIPCKPTKANGGRTRNLPHHDPDKWAAFKKYCIRDVEVERAIRIKLEKFPVPKQEQKLWTLDQKINDGGIRVNPVLVRQAIKCDTQYQKRLEEEAVKLTGLDNPGSVAQLKYWLRSVEGLEVKSLSKDTIPVILEKVESDAARRVLELRREMSKTSIKKYEAMARARCKDSRIRGLLQFYGANRTGRWAGRLVQVQNLPQNHMPDLDAARRLLIAGDFDTLELLFDSVPVVLSQLIRTAFIPDKGCRFIVADFSAIEARVIAWLAGEKWVLDVFKSHGKIYEAAASQMFHVPIDRIVKGSPEYDLRQKGKVAVLACGYQGGVGALISMGALKMGLPEEELPGIVRSWRQSNPKIVKFWYDVEAVAMEAVREKKAVTLHHGLTFSYEPGIMFIRLPSGRRLAYVRPRIENNPRFDKPALTYEGLEQGTKQWGRLYTYGGKIVENIVQGTARDCLAEAMLRLDAAGYKIVMHVHDEVVLETPNGSGSLEEACEITGQSISWAPGLPMRADGYECDYYMKN
ncbi:MAG: DNA polymerase [Eubacteriales bacterium]